MLKLRVVNFWGAPGTGKSTAAAGLFHLMKIRGHSVELVGEYAKDVTWERNWGALSNQLMILAQQDQRLRRLDGQAKWVITDSPLPTGIAYMGDAWKPGLEHLTWEVFDHYVNYNILLTPGDFPYEQAGRNQDQKEAMILGNVLDQLFHSAQFTDGGFGGIELKSNPAVPHEVYDWLQIEEGGEL